VARVRRRLAAVLALALLAGACRSGAGDGAASSPVPPTSSTMSIATSSTTSIATSTLPTVTQSGGAAPACPPVPARNAPDPNRPSYVLRVDVDLAANVVRGDVTVRFTPDVDTDRLVFRLWPNSPRIAAKGGRLDTGPVTLAGGHPVAAQRTDATTLVVQTGPLKAGRTVEATVPYQLTLPGEVDDRISRTGDSVRLGSFFPLLAWEPGVGWATEPPTSGFAEAATSPVADFAVSVRLPQGLTALTSGVAEGNDGRFRATAVRDFAMSVGRFATVTAIAHAPDDVTVTVGVAPGLNVSPSAFLAKEVRVLEDFGRRFGNYPWPSLTLAVTPHLDGGIEFPGHIQQGPATVGRTTSHEVGHQWFYALVGNDQGRDPWLDEGLASYAEARYENTLAGFRSTTIPLDARGRAGAPMTYWEPRKSSYYRGVYVQGTQALAALGDPGLVDCALRHYVARNAFRIATPADLVAALQTVFPDALTRMAPYGVHA
jgi:hypothetical protein